MSAKLPGDVIILSYNFNAKNMNLINSKEFTAEKAWGSILVAEMEGITAKVHWTNQPYKWHVNDGAEVFAVLDGCVEMLYKKRGQENSVILNVGDIFYASPGDEHKARPIGEARILVVEKKGSV